MGKLDNESRLRLVTASTSCLPVIHPRTGLGLKNGEEMRTQRNDSITRQARFVFIRGVCLIRENPMRHIPQENVIPALWIIFTL